MDLGILERMSKYRQCTECGEEFTTSPEAMALEKFADHLTIHQPTVGQWSNAYSIMQRSRK